MFTNVTRKGVLELASQLMRPGVLDKLVEQVPDMPAKVQMIALRHWLECGAQSVELPETYAAALMATDPGDALVEERLPWPCFEIQIPGGLLKGGSYAGAEIFSVWVSGVPPWLSNADETAIMRDQVFIFYQDHVSCSVRQFANLAAISNGTPYTAVTFDGKVLPPEQGSMWIDPTLAGDFKVDVEDRVWVLIERLVANVIITINTARIDKPKAYPSLPLREKRGIARLNTHKVGQPLTIDCRQSINDYVSGERRNSPSVTTLVRGHRRWQPYGKGRALRKSIWIEPHYRGQGELLVRPTRLK